jgi:hypothetical protein
MLLGVHATLSLLLVSLVLECRTNMQHTNDEVNLKCSRTNVQTREAYISKARQDEAEYLEVLISQFDAGTTNNDVRK